MSRRSVRCLDCGHRWKPFDDAAASQCPRCDSTNTSEGDSQSSSAGPIPEYDPVADGLMELVVGVLLFPFHLVAALFLGSAAVLTMFEGLDLSEGCGCLSSVSLTSVVFWTLLCSCCCCGLLPDCGGSGTQPTPVMPAPPAPVPEGLP